MDRELQLLLLGDLIGFVGAILGGLAEAGFSYLFEGFRYRRQERRRWLKAALEWGSTGKKQSLRGADLQGMRLPKAQLAEADLSYADLRKADLIGRISRGAHEHIARILNRVVDIVGNRDALSQMAEVVHVDAMWITTPDCTRVLEQSNQFPLLGIHGNHRPTTFQKGLSSALQVLELLLSMRTGTGQLLAIDLR